VGNFDKVQFAFLATTVIKKISRFQRTLTYLIGKKTMPLCSKVNNSKKALILMPEQAEKGFKSTYTPILFSAFFVPLKTHKKRYYFCSSAFS